MPLITFLPNCWSWTSSTILDRSGESVQPCFIPDHRRKTFKLSPLSVQLSVGLSYMVFIMLGYVPSIPILLRVLSKMDVEFCQKHFLYLMWCITFIHSSVMWCITLIHLPMSNHLCIPGNNPIQLWCMIILICCWIWFAILCWVFLHLYSLCTLL